MAVRLKQPVTLAPNVSNHTVEPVVDALCSNRFTCWADVHPVAMNLIWTALVILIWWGSVKLMHNALVKSAKAHAKRRKLDDYGTKAIVGRTKPMRLVLRVTVAVFAVIAVLGIWGLQTAFTGLLAGAGFLGLVVGLAASESLGNLVAGFIIFSNKPFDLGDWVEIDTVQGIVEDVGLGATTIMTFDNEKITIPNRIVQNTRVKNFSHARKLRFRILVGVEYGSHIGKALSLLVELGKSHADVLKTPEPMAVSQGFGASSVDLELRVWVEPVRNSVIKVKTDLVHMIHDRFHDEGIEIAFPHTQLKGRIAVEQV